MRWACWPQGAAVPATEVEGPVRLPGSSHVPVRKTPPAESIVWARRYRAVKPQNNWCGAPTRQEHGWMSPGGRGVPGRRPR